MKRFRLVDETKRDTCDVDVITKAEVFQKMDEALVGLVPCAWIVRGQGCGRIYWCHV